MESEEPEIKSKQASKRDRTLKWVNPWRSLLDGAKGDFTNPHSPYISIVLYRVTLVQDPVLALHARTTPPRA
jgi:hypothetical protein